MVGAAGWLVALGFVGLAGRLDDRTGKLDWVEAVGCVRGSGVGLDHLATRGGVGRFAWVLFLLTRYCRGRGWIETRAEKKSANASGSAGERLSKARRFDSGPIVRRFFLPDPRHRARPAADRGRAGRRGELNSLVAGVEGDRRGLVSPCSRRGTWFSIAASGPVKSPTPAPASLDGAVWENRRSFRSAPTPGIDFGEGPAWLCRSRTASANRAFSAGRTLNPGTPITALADRSRSMPHVNRERSIASLRPWVRGLSPHD